MNLLLAGVLLVVRRFAPYTSSETDRVAQC